MKKLNWKIICAAAVLLTVVVVGVFLLQGTKEQKKEDNRLTLLGYSQLGSESGWRIANTQDIVDASERSEDISMMLYNANQSQTNQINAIRSFIAYQVDVIAFSPIVETGWDTVLKEAKQANIPVIIVDRDITTRDKTLYTCRIGSDFRAEGEKAGEYLLKKINTENLTHVGVVELRGTEKAAPSSDRADGFRYVVGDDSRVEILDSLCGDFVISKGYDAMTMMLDQYGSQIDVLYSHNDAMTYGAIQAIEEHGLVPGKDIIIISVDGEQKAIDLLKEGKINCVAECTPLQGEMLMELVRKLTSGEKVEREIILEEKCFTEYDDLSAIGPRGY